MTTPNQIRPKIFITRPLQFAATALEGMKNKYDIVIGSERDSRSEMIDFLKESDALLVKGHFRVEKEV